MFFIGLILTLQFPPSIGIEVHLVRSVPNLLLTEPLVVRIGSTSPGQQPKLDLDSQPVSWERLGTTLRNSLKFRPNRVVYIEADPEVEWQCVADAIDISRSVDAQVVLLTAATSDKR